MRRSLLLLVIAAATAQAQATPDAWQRVQQIAPGTHLRISSTQHGGACVVVSVAEDSLVCGHSNSSRTLLRSEIKTIKLARPGHSAALGAALGLGIGAGVGAGIGSGINSSNSGSLLHVSGQKSAGVGAAIGLIVGGITGALIGYGKDLFAGPILYRR